MDEIDKKITRLAESVEMPNGWYSGAWFDDDGEMQSGVPPCLREFFVFAVAMGVKRGEENGR